VGLGADGAAAAGGGKQQRKQQWGGGGAPDEDEPRFVAYVPLPDQAAIEQRVLEKKVRVLSWAWLAKTGWVCGQSVG